MTVENCLHRTAIIHVCVGQRSEESENGLHVTVSVNIDEAGADFGNRLLLRVFLQTIHPYTGFKMRTRLEILFAAFLAS